MIISTTTIKTTNPPIIEQIKPAGRACYIQSSKLNGDYLIIIIEKMKDMEIQTNTDGEYEIKIENMVFYYFRNIKNLKKTSIKTEFLSYYALLFKID